MLALCGEGRRWWWLWGMGWKLQWWMKCYGSELNYFFHLHPHHQTSHTRSKGSFGAVVSLWPGIAGRELRNLLTSVEKCHSWPRITPSKKDKLLGRRGWKTETSSRPYSSSSQGVECTDMVHCVRLGRERVKNERRTRHTCVHLITARGGGGRGRVWCRASRSTQGWAARPRHEALLHPRFSTSGWRGYYKCTGYGWMKCLQTRMFMFVQT